MEEKGLLIKNLDRRGLLGIRKRQRRTQKTGVEEEGLVCLKKPLAHLGL